MIKANKSQLYLAIIIIILLFIFSFLVFYIFNKNIKTETSNNIDIDFIESERIDIKNTLPVSDKIGKAYNGEDSSNGLLGYSEFIIKNESSIDKKYEIFLTKNKINSPEISEKYIKLYLTDEKDTPVKGFEKNLLPTFSNLLALSEKPNGILLYRGKISAKLGMRFKFRVWISDTYTLNNEEELFSFNINVREV